MQIKKILSIGIFSLLVFGFVGIFTIHAANIVDVNFPCPGSSIPGFPECVPIKDGVPTNDFVGYMLQAYQFGIGIVGIIAVGMIVYGGILIAWNTESIDKRGKGREMITSALTGIAVLFGSYLILNTINPELVKFNLAANLPDEKGTSTLSGASGSSNYICGKPGDIKTLPENITNFSNCASRNVNVSQDINIIPDEYYNSSAEIKSGAKLWTYPYFVKSKGPMPGSAKCLIYAYQNPIEYKNEVTLTPPYFMLVPVPGKVQKIYLTDKLEICGLTEKQDMGTALTGTEHSINLAKLSAAGVEVVSSGNCSDINKKECTSLTGMPPKAIDFLVSLANTCKSKEVIGGTFGSTSCLVRVTGGTETGHITHGSGKAIFDLSSTNYGKENLGALLQLDNRVKMICTSGGAESKFRKNCTTVEDAAHFHVEL
jgi:hypothetical protein